MNQAQLRQAIRQRKTQRTKVRLDAAPRKRAKRIPPALPPVGVERDYTRALYRLLKEQQAELEAALLPLLPAWLEQAQASRPTADSYGDRIGDFFDDFAARRGGEGRDRFLRELIQRMGQRAADINQEQVRRQFRAALGVDVFAAEPWLITEMSAWTRQNVTLITNMAAAHLQRAEATVINGARSGKSTKDIAAELRHGLGVSQARAKLIARDQLGKWNGQLTQSRQTAQGVKSYRWRNSGDRRVRGNPGGLYPKARHNHWTREGQVFAWSSPPADGAPGEAIQCRCWAEPIIPGFEDLLDDGPRPQVHPGR